MEDAQQVLALANSDSLLFAPVEDFTSFTGFSCGDDDLDDFIYRDAARYQRFSIMVTYGLFLPEDKKFKKMLSFVSLLSSSLEFSGSVRNATRIGAEMDLTFMPVVKLERLGVRQDVQGNGIGRTTVERAINILKEKQILGYRLLTVHAYKTAKPFYEKIGFMDLPGAQESTTTVPMYLDLLRWDKG